ncbi:unnamed protein product, partial [Chrysoparadoxa australica]
ATRRETYQDWPEILQPNTTEGGSVKVRVKAKARVEANLQWCHCWEPQLLPY